MSSNILNISKNASIKIKEILSDKNHLDKIGLRISVKSGGCAGLTYDMSYVSSLNDNDISVSTGGAPASFGLKKPTRSPPNFTSHFSNTQVEILLRYAFCLLPFTKRYSISNVAGGIIVLDVLISPSKLGAM